MKNEIRKVVIIGPESTGKSTLAAQLANQYSSLWVPEFARAYLLSNGMNYTFDDLLVIARGQLTLQDQYEERMIQQQIAQPANPSILFLDTDMYVMKVWCEFVFQNCHLWILDQVVKRKYDLYLLCHTDLPWAKDELREYPDLESRQKLYMIYKDIMVNQPLPWVDIRGGYNERFERAVAGINHFLF